MASIDIVLNDELREGTQATVSQWLIAIGDSVKKNQPIVELETDKVMMEIIAPESGVLNSIVLNTGDEITDVSVLGVIDTDIKSAVDSHDKTNVVDIKTQGINTSEIEKTTDAISNHLDISTNVSISPAVRRLSEQHAINLNEINGTGKDNRITSRDIQAYLSDAKPTKTLGKANLSSEHLPISQMRQSIANHMVKSLLHTAPHVTSVFNLDLSTIIAHRKKYKQEFLNQGVNLTFTAYFIAASVAAIKQQPLINSQLHENSIEVFKHINIGIGTALADKGLIVPVLKNCELKSLLPIAHDLTDLTNKARNNALKPIDVQDGTFTISNHGVSGSLIATPIIINQPQSAILGIGQMEKRVIVKEINGDDVMLVKPMCYVSLTIDHRVLDAHQTNQFLNVFVKTLENWND